MTSRQVGGANGRKNGYKFEDMAVQRGATRPLKEYTKDIFGGIKTRSKTDVIKNGKNYSLKNPTDSKAQIQLCPVDRFCKLFKITGTLKLIFDQFFGNHGIAKSTSADSEFEQKLVEWNLSRSSVSGKNEFRRRRLLASSIPNFNLLTKWFEDNKREVLEFIFKTSFNNPNNKEQIADHVIWSTEHLNFDSSVCFKIDDLIDDICAKKNNVKIRPSQSVVEIGPVTLQMKGSKGSSYHSMQFNARLVDILKLMPKSKIQKNYGLIF